MRAGLPAGGFLRHRGLILAAAGGAVAEAGLLTLIAPAARPVAPQVTALPVLAAYHDLRWLFTDSGSWLGFVGITLTVLLVRAAVDTALLRLAWPRELRPPGVGRAFWSCLALTALAWLLLSPAVTLAFGVAVLPFSWPFLAALLLMLGIAAALSHGGVIVAWWRRLPPLRCVLWLLASFLVLSAGAAVIAHLGTAAALGVAAVSGMINARAWYGLAGVAARVHPRTPASVPAKVLFGLPFAPIAALMTVALVVGVARLMFTGTIQLPISTSASPVAVANAIGGGTAGAGAAAEVAANPRASAGAAVLVVSGWGSSCCDAANSLRAAMPGADVRQFSYVGLDARDFPIRHGPSADDLPLPVLGDRIAAQLEVLHNQTHRPVDVVAESEGTLGVYAMLSRHPGLPVGSVVLLSPIVDPGRVSYRSGPDDASVSEAALNELNHLAGEISPYGPSGAEHLLNSVSEFGAKYFDTVSTESGKSLRWLAVVPLADAVTLPVCTLPPDVIVVPAFHGGLLGDGSVLPMVSEFLDGQQVSGTSDMREAAEVITGAAAAWRMPDTRSACPG
jgi:hypothetical protein